MPGTKPISEKQLAANRRNAKKSTGPRSSTARQKVSLNAVRHGLAGHATVVGDEDRAAHQTFCAELIDEMAPANATELNLAQLIANDLWRLNRAHAIETNMLAAGVDEYDPNPDHVPAMQVALATARTFRDHANQFALLTLYEQRINRVVHKNRAELRQIQTERRQARQMQLEQIIAEREQSERKPEARPDEHVDPASHSISVNNLPAQSAPNGFVYAKDISSQSPILPPLLKAA